VALVELLWLAVPVVAAGLVHLVVLKLDLMPALRRLPLDAGATFRGRRVFGANKTWRGAVVTITTMTLASMVLAALHDCCWNLPLLTPFAISHPVAWGLLLGTGYIAGELPNSFTKRQLGIAPGAAGQGAAGRVFWVIDQLDSLAGMLLFIAPVWRPSLALFGAIVAIMLVAHPVGAWVMVQFGVKDRVG
jgi:CDP-2,3-bis-(O-geranylgeranyl)-sn-glycerol synthase